MEGEKHVWLISGRHRDCSRATLVWCSRQKFGGELICNFLAGDDDHTNDWSDSYEIVIHATLSSGKPQAYSQRPVRDVQPRSSRNSIRFPALEGMPVYDHDYVGEFV